MGAAVVDADVVAVEAAALAAAEPAALAVGHAAVFTGFGTLSVKWPTMLPRGW